MPPYHPIFGHWELVAGIISKVPTNVYGHVLPYQIKLKLSSLGPIFYIETWPYGLSMLVIIAPDQAYQITQAHSLPKFRTLADHMRPVTGGHDVISIEGKEWRTWRNISNPGFKIGHLMKLVPEMVKEVSIF